jgi:hypothetical protein
MRNLIRLFVGTLLVGVPAMGQQCKGTISLVNVDGNGPNSAQLEFSIVALPTAKCPGATFVVLAYPSTEPQVFAGITNIVTAAFFAKQPVTVTWEATGSTPRAIGVQIDDSSGPVLPPNKSDGKRNAHPVSIFKDASGVWAAQDNGYDVNAFQAKDFCANLAKLTGQPDWRLPGKQELLGLFDATAINQFGHPIRLNIKLTADMVWTQTTSGTGTTPFVVVFRDNLEGNDRAENSNAGQFQGIRALCLNAPLPAK